MMFSLVFLVCNSVTGMCYTAAPPDLYTTIDACQKAAISRINDNAELQKQGLAQPEQAAFQCVGWGEPV